jgi:hypothetical protein
VLFLIKDGLRQFEGFSLFHQYSSNASEWLWLLFATSFNKKRIDLEKSPFMNYQGTGAAQWLVALPLMVLPLLIWYVSFLVSNEIIATATLAILGIIGLLLRNFLMNKIVLLYKKQKYAMINGFKQQEN